MAKPTAKPAPPPPTVQPAHPVPPRASASRSVSSAAAQGGSGDQGAPQGGDWLAEREIAPEPQGETITSPKRDSAGSGRTRESRRGSHY